MPTDTINIYTSKDQRKEIDKIKVKYQLSLTTIVDILVFTTTKLLKSTEKLEELTSKYVYKKGGKTSIKKPKIFRELKWQNIKENRFATNVLMIYLHKDISKWLEKEDITKYYNMCNEKMTKTTDEFWNYNQHIRMQRRMLRENKEYFKKELENA